LQALNTHSAIDVGQSLSNTAFLTLNKTQNKIILCQKHHFIDMTIFCRFGAINWCKLTKTWLTFLDYPVRSYMFMMLCIKTSNLICCVYSLSMLTSSWQACTTLYNILNWFKFRDIYFR